MQNHIYVCDVDKPWQVFLVVSCKSKVVAVEWHVGGTRLLIATALGKCQIWHMQNFMLNQWEMEATADLPGEEIVSIAWFHQGSKAVFNGDKKESMEYLEKVSKTRCTPTLCQYGGRPLDGWVAVTVSGLVAAGVPCAGSKEMRVKMESLTPGRVRISLVDIAFNPNGLLGIVTSDGQLTSAIQSYTVKIMDHDASLQIQCKAAPSFYANCQKDAAFRDSATALITHVKFMQRDSSDVLMVAAGDNKASHIELWNIVTELITVHRMYQNAGQPESTLQRKSWSFHSSIQHGSLPLSLAVPKFPITYHMTDPSAQMFQYVAVAYKDGSVKLVNKANFQPMATTNLDMGWSDMGTEKRRRVIAHLSVMEQTLTGCALVGIDQLGTMYAMKVVNTRDPVTHVSPVYLRGLMEYCMIAGYDWWDILAALRHNTLDVCEKLEEHFHKQPAVLQELYVSRFLAMKGSLYRCVSSHKAADTHCLLLLHCIRAHFNIILRPKLSAAELGPLEKLSLQCENSSETELEKLVVALSSERTDYAVDSGSLQALQPLLQWITDVSLYLLAAIPSAQTYSTFPGASLLHDAGVLGMLRELLVVTYFWGMITPSCLPHLTSSTTECLQRLFTLMTKLWVKAKERRPDFEDSFVDDCCLLASHLPVPQMDQGMFGNTNYNTSIFLQSQPVKFSYGEVPGYVTPNRPCVFSPDGQPPSDQIKDVVRLINLGTRPPEEVKACSRCGCFTLAEGAAKVAATGSWDGKWVRQCLCGGMWTLAYGIGQR